MASLIPQQRRSTRTRKPTIRFNPCDEKWIPGASNGHVQHSKIDHWQLRYNGYRPETGYEKESDKKYENAIERRMLNDKYSEVDKNFIATEKEISEEENQLLLKKLDEESEYDYSDSEDEYDSDDFCQETSDEEEDDDEEEIQISALPKRLRHFTESELQQEENEL